MRFSQCCVRRRSTKEVLKESKSSEEHESHGATEPACPPKGSDGQEVESGRHGRKQRLAGSKKKRKEKQKAYNKKFKKGDDSFYKKMMKAFESKPAQEEEEAEEGNDDEE